MLSFPFHTVCITGGTGFFGQACLAYFRQHHPDVHIRIVSRHEYLQKQVMELFGEQNVSYLLGDVRDIDRLRLAFRGVDLVIHAAALKQVPAGEYNPSEFAQTNVNGTAHVSRACLDCGVQKAILLSSDKAVHSQTLYGSTKHLAERLFIQANSYSREDECSFVCTRYGNVMGSRGSALEHFKEKLASAEPLPLTDQRMTRFWMSADEAIVLVLFAAKHAMRGEIFVPELPAFQMTDMLRAILGLGEGDTLSPGQVETIGKRPGEKLHESLLSLDEIERCSVLSSHTSAVYVVQPMLHSWGQVREVSLTMPDDAILANQAEYSSQTWPWRLRVEDIRQRLQVMGVIS